MDESVRQYSERGDVVAKESLGMFHGPDVMVSGDIKEMDMGTVFESVVEVLIVPFISFGKRGMISRVSVG